MSLIARMPGFPLAGAPAWALSEPPVWRGFAAAAPEWWMPGAALALDFAGGRYMRGGAARTRSAVLSALRTGALSAFDASGNLVTAAEDEPLILPGTGYFPNAQRTNDTDYANLALLARGANTTVTFMPEEAGPDGKTGAVYRVRFPAAGGSYLSFNDYGASSAARSSRVWTKANGPDNRYQHYRDGTQVSPLKTAGAEWAATDFSATGAATWGISNGDDSYATDILIWMPYVGAGAFYPSPLVVPPAATVYATSAKLVQGVRPSNGAPEPFPGWEAAGLDEGFVVSMQFSITRALGDYRYLFEVYQDVGHRLYAMIDNANKLSVYQRTIEAGTQNQLLLQSAALGVGDHDVRVRILDGAYELRIGGALVASSSVSRAWNVFSAFSVGIQGSAVTLPFCDPIARLQVGRAA